MGDHALLIYPLHGQGTTSDVDNAEAFTFYEINLHLHFVKLVLFFVEINENRLTEK